MPPVKPEHAWFPESRFGLFIHWGLYALPARHEWVRYYEEIDNAAYEKYFAHFDPDLYDPKAWARQAREAGMRYVVITAKHHDGFCLWDSAATDYKITNTPFGRDALREFVEAFRAEGLKIGFYYSLLDWHHPDFPIDFYHPQRNHPDMATLNEGRDIRRYADYMQAQVRELLSDYGHIDVIWYDFSYANRAHRGVSGKGKADWNSEALWRLSKQLQPHILINNRLDLTAADGFPPELTTPEQYTPREVPLVDGKEILWEACHTLSGSWGYHRDEATWKSPEQLIKMLVDTVALGGNLLMNIGPTGRGQFDHRASAALEVYGHWLAVNGRSIYGAGAAGYPAPPDCRFTRRGDSLYVHVYSWPFRHLHLKGLGERVEYAQFLHDASEVRWLDTSKSAETSIDVPVDRDVLTLELPVAKPDVVVPVIELFLKPGV